MSVRNAKIELTTGCEMSCSTVPVGVSGGGAKMETYTQPDWYDNSSIDNQVTKVGYASGTLAAAATANIDLTALTGLDGSAVSLATLIVFYVQVTSATGLLRVGNAASNAHALDFGAATHTRTLRPGPAGSRGPGHAVADPSGVGFAVDGTHKIILLENTHGSESVTYTLMAGGL